MLKTTCSIRIIVPNYLIILIVIFEFQLDFGENFITVLSSNMFGDTIRVNDLNLDHNYIETIGARSFESLEPRRLYLASNRIQLIDDEAFAGSEATLELIDLEGNQLNNVSSAFSKLKKLR